MGIKRKEKIYQERDLYKPVKDFFTDKKYMVKGEINNCDVVAVNEDTGDIICIELKVAVNLELLLQAVQRQKLFDTVYIAVFKPSVFRDKRWKNIYHMIRRLELGLLFVKEDESGTLCVEEKAAPVKFDRFKSIKSQEGKRRKILEEFEERKSENVGGVNKVKIITAYREKAIFIAKLLYENGPMTAAQLRKLGTDNEKTYSILRSNFYGWFENTERGIYKLTELGIADIKNINM